MYLTTVCCVCLPGMKMKIAVSFLWDLNRLKSHHCLASFSLSHCTPNLAAGTSFSARCTSCTLEKIFLLGTLHPDRLLFVSPVEL